MHGIDAWGELRFSNAVAALPSKIVAAAEGSDPALMTTSGIAKEGQTKASLHKFLLSRLSQLVNPQPCLLYTSPSPRDYAASRMPSSA